jgi:hypothetical protein
MLKYNTTATFQILTYSQFMVIFPFLLTLWRPRRNLYISDPVIKSLSRFQDRTINATSRTDGRTKIQSPHITTLLRGLIPRTRVLLLKFTQALNKSHVCLEPEGRFWLSDEPVTRPSVSQINPLQSLSAEHPSLHYTAICRHSSVVQRLGVGLNIQKFRVSIRADISLSTSSWSALGLYVPPVHWVLGGLKRPGVKLAAGPHLVRRIRMRGITPSLLHGMVLNLAKRQFLPFTLRSYKLSLSFKFTRSPSPPVLLHISPILFCIIWSP